MDEHATTAHEPRLTALTKLLDVTRELAALHDLDEILRAVTTTVCDALSCERGSLFLYDADREELFTRVATQLEIEEIRTPIDAGITGWVARRRKIANIPDPHVDARWNSAIDRKTGFQTRNILAVPLFSHHDGRFLGVLQLLNKRDGKFTEFDEQIVEAFGSHASAAIERAELLHKARQSQELQVAVDVGRQIQTSFLPDELTSIPGYGLAAWWKPAEQVSGDYYDVLPLPDGRTGLLIADVSGHGIGASLIMASVRAMLKVLAGFESDPARIVARLAETVQPDLPDGRFFTLFCAALDPQSHSLEFVNAGHSPVLLYRRETGTVERLPSTTMPIGFVNPAEVAAAEPVALQPADVCLLGTDGLVERRNESAELFGKARLKAVLAANADLGADDIVAGFQKAIDDYSRERDPLDDIALMIVKRSPTADESGGGLGDVV